MDEELVILVDDDNQEIGTAPKATVHHGDTPLHRAFSCFLFDRRGQLLLQQRAASKRTWPEIWSNSCCGHPAPGEPAEAAVRRRLEDELGVTEVELTLALPDYRYRAEHLGVVEHEICPVWVGWTDQAPRANPEEVMALRWTPWLDFVDGVRGQAEEFFRELSPWCREETTLLRERGVVEGFLAPRLGLAS